MNITVYNAEPHGTSESQFTEYAPTNSSNHRTAVNRKGALRMSLLITSRKCTLVQQEDSRHLSVTVLIAIIPFSIVDIARWEPAMPSPGATSSHCGAHVVETRSTCVIRKVHCISVCHIAS